MPIEISKFAELFHFPPPEYHSDELTESQYERTIIIDTEEWSQPSSLKQWICHIKSQTQKIRCIFWMLLYCDTNQHWRATLSNIYRNACSQSLLKAVSVYIDTDKKTLDIIYRLETEIIQTQKLRTAEKQKFPLNIVNLHFDFSKDDISLGLDLGRNSKISDLDGAALESIKVALEAAQVIQTDYISQTLAQLNIDDVHKIKLGQFFKRPSLLYSDALASQSKFLPDVLDQNVKRELLSNIRPPNSLGPIADWAGMERYVKSSHQSPYRSIKNPPEGRDIYFTSGNLVYEKLRSAIKTTQLKGITNPNLDEFWDVILLLDNQDGFLKFLEQYFATLVQDGGIFKPLFSANVEGDQTFHRMPGFYDLSKPHSYTVRYVITLFGFSEKYYESKTLLLSSPVCIIINLNIRKKAEAYKIEEIDFFEYQWEKLHDDERLKIKQWLEACKKSLKENREDRLLEHFYFKLLELTNSKKETQRLLSLYSSVPLNNVRHDLSEDKLKTHFLGNDKIPKLKYCSDVFDNPIFVVNGDKIVLTNSQVRQSSLKAQSVLSQYEAFKMLFVIIDSQWNNIKPDVMISLFFLNHQQGFLLKFTQLFSPTEAIPYQYFYKGQPALILGKNLQCFVEYMQADCVKISYQFYFDQVKDIKTESQDYNFMGDNFVCVSFLLCQKVRHDIEINDCRLDWKITNLDLPHPVMVQLINNINENINAYAKSFDRTHFDVLRQNLSVFDSLPSFHYRDISSLWLGYDDFSERLHRQEQSERAAYQLQRPYSPDPGDELGTTPPSVAGSLPPTPFSSPARPPREGNY